MDKKVKKQLAKVADAKEARAVQEEYAPDWIERAGIRFHKPNLAALWFFNRLKMLAAGFESLEDLGVCLVYASGLDQAAVRNIAIPAITKGELPDKAYGWVIDNGLSEADVNDVIEELWNPILLTDEESGKEDESGKKETGDEKKPRGSNRSGGAK